jgi:hypothetical protein
MQVEERVCRIHQGKIHWHVMVCGCMTPLMDRKCPRGSACTGFQNEERWRCTWGLVPESGR